MTITAVDTLMMLSLLGGRLIDGFWKGMTPFLPYLTCIVLLRLLYLVGLLALRKWQRMKLLALGISDIDQLSGRDFERLLQALFERKGFAVELTPYCKDWGADLVISRGGVRTVVQAKRTTKRLGVKGVQEVVASKAEYGAAEALLVTNNTLTEAALKLARANRVHVWERKRLINELLKLNMPDRTGMDQKR
ncbi:MAG TPA: restriction endonuclease [Fimbriimonadaceae bacterium]|nr:restriction endonuclease [Fimbriimonadaceae bacterium]